MDYLEASVFLKTLIQNANSKLLKINSEGLAEKNQMIIRTNFGKEIDIKMDSFTNEFVKKTINEYNSEAFVMTDLVSANNNGKEYTYFLYKGYHKFFDKGLVYFQLVNKKTLKPIGELEFSNLEDNVFYKINTPNFEESSCNAIESAENTAKEPCIVFLIGHMSEERLIYDIHRLIFDTANNVQKHKNRHFKFYIQVSIFGRKASPDFINKINSIKETLHTTFSPSYPNTTFIFDLDNE